MRVVGFVIAYLICSAVAWWASRYRPKIRPVLPIVFVLGLVGAGFYFVA